MMVLLIAACAAVAAVVGAVPTPRHTTLFLMAMLSVGLPIAHTALAILADHDHGPSMSVTMLAAHITAIAVTAAAIHGAEGSMLAAAAVARIAPIPLLR
ncbi:hypothetical protein [Rhodococcus sp. ACPA1]|uniref:hypothetical protein n=1 Tax=Rhodococcus sp. ACPA1 TaxID=2028572 RepID=UPI000BB152AB|nr:hypothetical protein [Rhodococcus sp. ACPA1]PBC47189.1 hypothetical protein CJ177_43495 [Rhodococcus sp. ACPA1]